MITIDITEDNKFLYLMSPYVQELNIVKAAFVREVKNAWLLRKKSKFIETKRAFITDLGYMPVGLWLDLLQYCKQNNIQCNFTQRALNYINQFNTLNKDEFFAYVKNLFDGACNADGKPFMPYDYQIDAAYTLLKYRFSSAEISTSAGKTLIAYILFKYLYHQCNINRILYIVPNVDLATQSTEKFLMYESFLKNPDYSWSSGILKGGLTKKQSEAVDTCNILFGTYQSLNNKETDFFKDFYCVINDECCHPDTLISMSDGTVKAIKDVNVGDIVKTYNEDTKQLEDNEVEYVYKNLSPHTDIFEIELEDGNILKVTGNHKIYTENRGYIRADELTTDDILISQTNSIYKIKSITKLPYNGDVYNLRIKSDNDLNHNYFANNVCISNCHHTQAVSVQKSIAQCINARYIFGVTGTYPKQNTIENLTLKSYMGPMVYTLTADSLINDEKAATPIYVIFQNMDWATEDEKNILWEARNIKSAGASNIDYQVGTKLLRHEMKFVNTSGKRLKYIGDMAIKMANNTLILFGDIKGGYGKRIYEYIKQYSDKTVFYIDGTTPPDKREYYKQYCEDDTTGKTILVASIGTFGEGIDICNIWSIFLINSAKSERLIRQICGRGLRRYPGKDKTVLYDFVDDLRYSQTGRYNDNYLWTHYKERKKIYKEQNFPIYEQEISIKDEIYGFN